MPSSTSSNELYVVFTLGTNTICIPKLVMIHELRYENLPISLIVRMVLSFVLKFSQSKTSKNDFTDQDQAIRQSAMCSQIPVTGYVLFI